MLEILYLRGYVQRVPLKKQPQYIYFFLIKVYEIYSKCMNLHLKSNLKLK